MDKNGKFNTDKETDKIRQGEYGKEFVLASKEDLNLNFDIVITESDIDNLKRAKAAIFSAASILVKHMGFDFSQIEQIFIAGGFGTYLDMEKSITIGLLPDVSRDRFKFIGNSSLVGARQILLSSAAFKKAQDITMKMTYLELSVDAGYMDEYMAALFFPHTDSKRFKTVKI
jgi:uncharacterized 2Fe-2S/4Fe-4S cluster protein (DUF4445 family)